MPGDAIGNSAFLVFGTDCEQVIVDCPSEDGLTAPLDGTRFLLGSDVDCNVSGIALFFGPDTSIDCRGHTLNGQGCSSITCRGIVMDSNSDLSNCVVGGFNPDSFSSTGIVMVRGNSALNNVTVTGNGVGILFPITDAPYALADVEANGNTFYGMIMQAPVGFANVEACCNGDGVSATRGDISVSDDFELVAGNPVCDVCNTVGTGNCTNVCTSGCNCVP